MPRTRIKICGLTRREDALAAVAAGVDALGLVFYADSPRGLSIAAAQALVQGLPPLVTLVGLFVDAEADYVHQACQRLPLGLLQFHGSETQAYCGAFAVPWMKALRVAADSDIEAMIALYPEADAILLDTYRAGRAGGTGECFDWGKIPPQIQQPWVLAGGLQAGNVGTAIAAARPFAVDVSGGVEAAPGIKDPRKITEFVAAVSAADRTTGVDSDY